MKLWTLNKVIVTFRDPTNHSLNGQEHKKLQTCFCRSQTTRLCSTFSLLFFRPSLQNFIIFFILIKSQMLYPHLAKMNASDQSISLYHHQLRATRSSCSFFTSIWIELLLWVVWVLVHHWRGWVKESRAIFHSRSVPELRPLLKRESEFRGGDRSNERSDDRNDAWVFSCCGGRAPLQSSSGYIYLHLNHLHNSAAITAPRHSRKYHIHNTKYESFSIRKLGFFSSPVYSQYMTQKSHF